MNSQRKVELGEEYPSGPFYSVLQLTFIGRLQLFSFKNFQEVKTDIWLDQSSRFLVPNDEGNYGLPCTKGNWPPF